MEWTKDKPKESGWYEFQGELHPYYIGTIPINCDPSCVVRVEMGRKPKLEILNERDLYDFDAADGLWRGPFENPPDTEQKRLAGRV